MTGRPSGMVTFLFTDIEGSTRRWERDSDRMRADANLAVFFDRDGRPEVAATMYGASTHHPIARQNVHIATTVEHLRAVLDIDTFDDCVRTGSTMSAAEAVHYAQGQIERTRRHRT